MNLRQTLLAIIVFHFLALACKNGEEVTPDAPADTTSTNNPTDTTSNILYFPPNNSTDWETVSVAELGWDADKLPELYTFLENNNTRGFIVLKNGKIVLEKYFGKKLNGTDDFDVNANWYWASAGKTITATLIGIAQQEGKLSIDDKTSDYLGVGWTSLSTEKEALITIKHQLTMTTGLDYTVSDIYCTEPSCLTYKADAGTQWYYHNAPYTLLDGVIEDATGQTLANYTKNKIADLIGMEGFWLPSGYNNVYYSTPRSMARFGLLMLNKGTWKEQAILTDKDYYNAMVSTSQNLNLSYGYLWWLNGKASAIYPGLPNVFNGAISPNAPSDLYAGIGKNGQFVDIVPSQNLVVIRMGEAPSDSEVPTVFHNDMWAKLNAVIR